MPRKRRDLSGTARCLDCGKKAEHENGPGTPLVIRHDESCLSSIVGLTAQAEALMRRDANEATVRMLDQLMESGRGEWITDPNMAGVAGLVIPGTLRAYAVVYVNDRDFEIDEDLMLAKTGDL